MPIICYRQKKDPDHEWTLYDLADRLAMKGWQVPAYPLPANLDKVEVQRLVIRADFGMSMAHDYVEDMKAAVRDLDKSHLVYHEKAELKKRTISLRD